MRKIGSRLIVGLTLAVAGCAQDAQLYNGDGERKFAVACLDNQTIAGMTECMHRANQLCPKGYYWNGSTDHPLAQQITEPTPELAARLDKNNDITSILDYNAGRLTPGGYGWKTRIVKPRGDYHYITITCK